MIEGKLVRNVIAIMRSLDRHEIEAEAGKITDAFWMEFQANPYRSFLRMNDQGQDAVARAICARAKF